jgi:hypothetical protein
MSGSLTDDTYDVTLHELSGYHLPSLLQAEAGRLVYDRARYSVHGIPNNAVACCWAGLLADGDGGMKLTDKGRELLAHARIERPELFSEWESEADGTAEPVAVGVSVLVVPEQLTLDGAL